MATEYPPLGKSYVLSYSNDDKNFPIIAIKKDPRVDNYRRPDDLSPHPEPSRYPNHRFTSTQPTNTDERVIWIYEILPAPYVPFTRYDDDLGPVQGRRRFVVNSGQEASLERDKKVSYEAREGSAIVSSEIEETWDAGSTDPDLESPFPIKDRDFYDPSRGPVQERRQLVSTTGDEVASLENNNGVITQISYEAYNEYLSFKVVQTYSVNGPQLVGFATNNQGQLTTVTTQRKGADNYDAPQPTALKTVEAVSEDAESIVERIVETPNVFPETALSSEIADPLPNKFRSVIPAQSEAQLIEGTVTQPNLAINEISSSEQQVTEFVKRVSKTKRGIVNPYNGSLSINAAEFKGQEFTTELGGGMAKVYEYGPHSGPTAPTFAGQAPKDLTGVVSRTVEDLGKNQYITREVFLEKTSQSLRDFTELDADGVPYNVQKQSLPILTGQDYDEELDIVIPYKQVVASPNDTQVTQGSRRRVTPRDVAHSAVIKYDIEDAQNSLDEYYWELPEMIGIELPDKLLSARVVTSRASASGSGSGFGDTFTWSYSKSESIRGSVVYNLEEGFRGNIPTIRAIFFLPKGSSSPDDVLDRLKIERDDENLKFWPNVRPQSHEIVVFGKTSSSEASESVSFNSGSSSDSTGGSVNVDSTSTPLSIHGRINIFGDDNFNGIIDQGEAASALVAPTFLPATQPYSVFPTGDFIYQINASPYKFSYTRIDALLVKITSEYV
jgi:hypothetical protein